MGQMHVPYYMLSGRGELSFKDIERAKNKINIGDPYTIEGYTKKLHGFVADKYKHYFRVVVPGHFKSYCVQYVDLLISPQ